MKQKYQISRVSPFSGKLNTLELEFDMKNYLAWSELGTPIQNAMPYLSADEREFLMTGITKEEWDNAFKGGN